MATRRHVLAMVLAGGEGKRLFPLTRDRAKPAVPFGGQYRLIDFVLSNLVNGGFRRIVVLTQYKSHSLDTHLAQTWRLSPMLGFYVAPVPAQMRAGPHWFAGSADAIFQNLNLIADEEPDYVIVFGADHIYRMDPGQMLDQHIESGAAATVAGIKVPIGEANQFGIIDATDGGKIRSFLEKPAKPPHIPGEPDWAFASMGNYVFTTEALREAVIEDNQDKNSRHDMGGSIIPMFVDEGSAWVYNFNENAVPSQTEREYGYWRDVGTLDAYFHASMDLVTVDPIFDLYNEDWPILTWAFPHPPAKFVHDHEGRRGFAAESLVSAGAIVSGAEVHRSIISPEVRLHSYSTIEDSVLFDGVDVGRRAVVRRAIVDKGVEVPPGYQIGVDPVRDKERFTVSDEGIVVIGKGDKLE